MTIRFAEEKDIPKMLDLLLQVCLVHHEGRPDLFGVGTKYGEEELRALLSDKTRPILVAADEDDCVLGYAFCILQDIQGDSVLCDRKVLYIDDICVDESKRGQGIATALYERVLVFARELGCHSVTLNVWCGNDGAMKFYEKCGMKPQKIGMETILC